MKGKARYLASLEELAIKTAAGERDAFGEIYGTLLDPVYRYLYWNLGSREEAEDLTEEVFLRCLTSIGSFDARRGPFKAWAFRIAHNLMVDHIRRRGRKSEEPIPPQSESELPHADEELERKERARALREALAELPAAQRQVIVMKYFAEMSNSEVAKALGRSEGAINALQHRALRRLGGMLEERGW